MDVQVTLQAKKRSVVGKQARQLRHQGWIPAVVYGPQHPSLAVQIARSEMMEVYRQAGTSAMIGLVLEGEKRARPAFIREIQRDPLSREILHVDLLLVDLERPITAHVPIVLVGESPVVAKGLGVVTHSVQEVEVHGLPTDLPHRIEVDLGQIRRVDQTLLVKDLPISDKVQILSDPDAVVLYVSRLRRAAELEEEVEEEMAAEVEAAEE